jgi:dipeptidyl aminopeptidase
MHTPQHNLEGYENATISDAAALGENTRFLIMHGVADDNVHLQNTLVLIDKLDLANIDNYDMQVFPDSDHSIFFHNGHTLVYEREFLDTPPRRKGTELKGTNVDRRSFELARQCVQWRMVSHREPKA